MCTEISSYLPVLKQKSQWSGNEKLRENTQALDLHQKYLVFVEKANRNANSKLSPKE